MTIRKNVSLDSDLKLLMKIHHFETKHSVLNKFMAELRDVDIQKDAMRFRRNIETDRRDSGVRIKQDARLSGQKNNHPFGFKKDIPARE